MSARVFALWIALCAALSSAAACSFDDGANAAHGCDERCAVCHFGFCITTLEQAATGTQSGAGAVSGASAGTLGGSAGTGSVAGAGAGTSAGASVGAGAGTGAGAGAGAGTSGGAGAGAGAGSGGGPAPCVPAPETCNANDDDCDAKIDEDTDVVCYPAGTIGCVARSDGGFDCVGSCAAGMQTCQGGVPSACTGAITPKDEMCGGEEAADENCNAQVDDGCPCEGSETQRCYSGPLFTRGVGLCRSGMQQCENGEFGDCVGAITPVAETCANDGADDNCNFVRDDVPNRGGFCVDFGNQGVCFSGSLECHGGALSCDTPAPAARETLCDNLDEDCDGDVDEDFELSADERNCGGCNVRCAAGDLCCGGVCRDIDTDSAHCGACGEECVGDTSCCGGDCMRTDTDDRCGGCNITCAGDEDCCGEHCTNVETVTDCGGCNIQCDDGEACCEDGCARLDTKAHCGSCDMKCGESQECCGGHCVDPDPDAGTACP